MWSITNGNQRRSMDKLAHHTLSPYIKCDNRKSVFVQPQRRTFVGPLGRIAAQLAATVAVVFSKAFMQALSQAQAQAANPKAAAENIIKKKEMDVAQAYEVLNLESGATVDEIEENFEKYFSANDPDNGGSFYLQSKIHNARNVVLADLHGDTESEDTSA